MFNSAYTHNHNLNISSGTEKTKYLLALNHIDQDGNIHVINVGNVNNFDIDGNTLVYQYKLVLVADVNFPDNEPITIKITEARETFNNNILNFKIKVLKN